MEYTKVLCKAILVKEQTARCSFSDHVGVLNPKHLFIMVYLELEILSPENFDNIQICTATLRLRFSIRSINYALVNYQLPLFLLFISNKFSRGLALTLTNDRDL